MIARPSAEELAELTRCAREAYNDGRWVQYPANFVWEQVVIAVLQRRANQVGDFDGD